MEKLNRKAFLRIAALACASIVTAGWLHTADAAATSGKHKYPTIPAETTWPAFPEQVPAAEGIAALPGGAKLYYWDTGGKGEPIVLMHAATGSAMSWEYQQPVLAKAGFRVIAYSRRGSYKSEPPDPAKPPKQVDDLQEFVDYLKLDRFHLVATAAGGFIAFDYATSHQDRLISLTVANSLGGIQDDAYGATLRALLPSSFNQLPPDFRELGPSYRAGNPEGVKKWLHNHELAGPMMRPSAPGNPVTWASLEALQVPTLLITGDCDLYMPPHNMRTIASHIPNSEGVIIAEVGHSASWEQPEIFNRELIKFLKKNKNRKRK